MSTFTRRAIALLPRNVSFDRFSEAWVNIYSNHAPGSVHKTREWAADACSSRVNKLALGKPIYRIHIKRK